METDQCNQTKKELANKVEKIPRYLTTLSSGYFVKASHKDFLHAEKKQIIKNEKKIKTNKKKPKFSGKYLENTCENLTGKQKNSNTMSILFKKGQSNKNTFHQDNLNKMTNNLDP